LAGERPPGDVESLAELLEVELGLPLGLLRPDDHVKEIFAPFTLGNPLTWLMAETRLEDGLTEVSYALRKRLKTRGRTMAEVHTVRDLFSAWCAGNS
jgi:hypothetical protein